MSSTTFPNGSTLVSSALTPQAIEALFQPLVAQILGIDPTTVPTTAYSAVRLGWQQEGQPAWAITDDVCIIRATLDSDSYGRTRDSQYVPRNDISLTHRMSFAQVWSIHLTLYGPNCADRARLILSAMTLDWVREPLAASQVYAVPDWVRPVYGPENFQGQWWPRADIDLRFNELVNESITAPSAAGVDVTVVGDSGISEHIHIGA